ncbi:MAG: CHAT domain-containing protein [Synechococcales bacterium]|nr:CHAT domain-containing protein [Synechococcales bacterium]
MSKLVIFKIGEGSFDQGFAVTLQIGEEGAPPAIQVGGRLPPLGSLAQTYEQWRSVYYHLGQMRWGMRITVPPVQITNLSNSQTCETFVHSLQQEIQQWFNQPSMVDLQLEMLDRIPADEPTRIILQTHDRQLQKLPWHHWKFFDRRPLAELALYSNCRAIAAPLQGPVRILAVFGHPEGLDLQADWQALQQLPHSQITCLEQPSLQTLHDHLWKPAWDILFFAGHSISSADGHRGEIHLQTPEALPLEHLQYALQAAVQHGLKLAFFNSCDGLGLTSVLEAAQVPQAIVMREPVPDPVAQKFLRYFLEEFVTGSSLDLSVRKARQQLHWMEAEFPCASWLPIICQNPAMPPLRWPQTIHPPEPKMTTSLLSPNPTFSTRNPSAHCINPDCPHPAPQRWQDLVCPHCGTSLRLQDRYIPVQRLETGRYLEVFRVYDLRSKTEQLLHILTTDHPQAIAQFEQETQALCQIRDRSLPRVGKPGSFMIELTRPQRLIPGRVLEQIEGQSLEAVIAAHPKGCPPSWVFSWLKQALQSLQKLHGQSVIHSHLTPAQLILRQGSGELAIAGFAKGDRYPGKTRSHSSALALSLSYRSPEQITQGETQPRTDFYALGMIAIHLLTGRHPQEFRDTETGIFHWRKALRIDRTWADLIDQMIHTDPRQRPKTAASLLCHLDTLPSPKSKIQPTQLSTASTRSPSHSPARSSSARPTSKSHNSLTPPLMADLPSVVRLGQRAIAGGIDRMDHLMAQIPQILYASALGGFGSGLAGLFGFFLLFLSPLPKLFPTGIDRLPMTPGLFIFAIAGWGTHFALSGLDFWQPRSRLWLTLLLLGLGYGGLAPALIPLGSRLAWLGLSAIAAVTIALSLGIRRSNLWQLGITLVGTLVVAGFWYRSLVWHPGFQSYLTVTLRPNAFLPVPVDCLPTVGLLAGLGAIVSFWLSTSYLLFTLEK